MLFRNSIRFGPELLTRRSDLWPRGLCVFNVSYVWGFPVELEGAAPSTWYAYGGGMTL